MEILAENRFQMTKQLFFEGLLRLSRDSYGKTAKKCTLFLLLIWVVMSALLLFIGGTMFQALVYLVVMLYFCLWLNVLAPRKNAKKSWEALVNRCGENPERITRFYEDRLEIASDGTLKIVPYSEIVAIKQTKQLCVLVCEDKVGIMVTKSGFVSGSAEEIMALIEGATKESL